MINKKLKISIIGTGALGGFYGMMLSQLGHDVHFLLNSDYEYVKKNGLTLKSDVFGELKLTKVNAYNNGSQMPISDLVLVTLKTNQNKNVLPEVLPYVTDKNTTVIMIQNGLGMEAELSNWFPELQIVGATALIGSRKEKNGIIIHESFGNIDFGSYNLKNSENLEQLISDLNALKIPAAQKKLDLIRWRKLVWNITFNGLSVTENMNTDKILKEHYEEAKALMQEVIDAAKANEVIIPASFVEGMISFTHKMGNYAPSMRFDYLKNQPLELEYMYKNPIEAAKKNGFEMRKTELLYKNYKPCD